VGVALAQGRPPSSTSVVDPVSRRAGFPCKTVVTEFTHPTAPLRRSGGRHRGDRGPGDLRRGRGGARRADPVDGLGGQPYGRENLAGSRVKVQDVVPADPDDPRGAAFSSMVLPLVLAGIITGVIVTLLGRPELGAIAFSLQWPLSRGW
jgi:hypothetical protein